MNTKDKRQSKYARFLIHRRTNSLLPQSMPASNHWRVFLTRVGDRLLHDDALADLSRVMVRNGRALHLIADGTGALLFV